MFPKLYESGYKITSPAQPSYNCIAWAAGDASRWWEPDARGLYFWPKSILRAYTLEAYEEAFKHLGFDSCEDPTPEAGWEKVALFTGADGRPTHAARQLTDGMWTSKLGRDVDIAHSNLDGLCGDHYGNPTVILRRRRGPPPSSRSEKST